MGVLLYKNALVSVSDKSGLIEFIKPFYEKGMRVVSTGGTAQYLKNHGINVVDVSEQTQFPEILDGRVKTLHPKIHMGLLARTHLPEDLEILKKYEVDPFDLVVGNLYPFEEALKKGEKNEELIEYIDIGGPSFLRSAAKSFHSITVVCDPSDYEWILRQNGELSFEEKKKLAAKIYSHTASYDSMISEALDPSFKSFHGLGGILVQELRYGENPQQKASWYSKRGAKYGLQDAEILQGKALSYNNLLDLDSASTLVCKFSEPVVVAVKHNNPCGVGLAGSIDDAIDMCLKADPVSIFGGIIAVNKRIDSRCAEKLSSVFLECVIAPEITDDAMTIFSKKKNLRVLKWKDLGKTELQKYRESNLKTIIGGYLLQSADEVEDWNPLWNVVGEIPSIAVKNDLLLAWKIVAALKSNALAIVGGSQSIGLGMGQVNRVDSVAQAIGRMQKYHPSVKNQVLASDAFFPFPDSIELIAEAGIKWVIQPGGSVNDEAVISTAKKLNVNLIFTNRRHFKH
jgi:phosphoribosylaminoimidazolecarboxamide formyltransferase/IMP cyclohydrolase